MRRARYQIAEGTFHLMICAGSLWLLLGKPRPASHNLLTLYRLGLALEIIFMDGPYGVAFTCLLTRSIPEYWGLLTFVVLLHHITVLPDFVSAWLEWQAHKAEKDKVS